MWTWRVRQAAGPRLLRLHLRRQRRQHAGLGGAISLGQTLAEMADDPFLQRVGHRRGADAEHADRRDVVFCQHLAAAGRRCACTWSARRSRRVTRCRSISRSASSGSKRRSNTMVLPRACEPHTEPGPAPWCIGRVISWISPRTCGRLPATLCWYSSISCARPWARPGRVRPSPRPWAGRWCRRCRGSGAGCLPRTAALAAGSAMSDA